jgi:hypothetical protein
VDGDGTPREVRERVMAAVLPYVDAAMRETLTHAVE